MQLIGQFHLLRLFALFRCGGDLQVLSRSCRKIRRVRTFLIVRAGIGVSARSPCPAVPRLFGINLVAHPYDPSDLVSELPSDLFEVGVRVLDGIV